MEKHIEKLISFIETHDPSKVLNTLSQDDRELKRIWKQAQNDREWRKINSRQDVEFLIKCFENCVISSPSNIRERNVYKFEILIAQYKVMRGLKKWCQNSNTLSILSNSNFPKLTDAEVDKLISRLERLMKMI